MLSAEHSAYAVVLAAGWALAATTFNSLYFMQLSPIMLLQQLALTWCTQLQVIPLAAALT